MYFDSLLRRFVEPFDRDLNLDLDLPVWQSRWRTARRPYSHRRRGVVDHEHCPDSTWRDQHRKPNSGVRGPLRHSRLLFSDLMLRVLRCCHPITKSATLHCCVRIRVCSLCLFACDACWRVCLSLWRRCLFVRCRANRYVSNRGVGSVVKRSLKLRSASRNSSGNRCATR
jgi:hypothetical protein